MSFSFIQDHFCMSTNSIEGFCKIFTGIWWDRVVLSSMEKDDGRQQGNGLCHGFVLQQKFRRILSQGFFSFHNAQENGSIESSLMEVIHQLQQVIPVGITSRGSNIVAHKCNSLRNIFNHVTDCSLREVSVVKTGNYDVSFCQLFSKKGTPSFIPNDPGSTSYKYHNRLPSICICRKIKV
uniref:Uncharacterized protein n=1 Tax=Opuntia streptacantha TaxID=393608 RepID=A0A7C9AT05_OPUST